MLILTCMRYCLLLLLSFLVSGCVTSAPAPAHVDFAGHDAATVVGTRASSSEGKRAQGVGVHIREIDGAKAPRLATSRVKPGQRAFLLYAYDSSELRAEAVVAFDISPMKEYRIGASREGMSWTFIVHLYERLPKGEQEIAFAEMTGGLPVVIPVLPQ